jgi:hypothetical protein
MDNKILVTYIIVIPVKPPKEQLIVIIDNLNGITIA